jgi:hypothetical protein
MQDKYLPLWSGLIHMRRGNYDAALDCFTRSQSNGMESWRIALYMGLTARYAGYYDQARLLMEHFEECVRDKQLVDECVKIFEGVQSIREVASPNSVRL